jgi:acetyl esterase/lipase
MQKIDTDYIRVVIIILVISVFFTGGMMAKDKKKVLIDTDISFAKVGGEELKLDIVRPDGKGPYPAVVFIHGGGWGLGTRKDYSSEIERAAGQGYVAASIDYRLSVADEKGKVKHHFPDQVQDVKCAFRWLRANAKKYKIDPKRIGVVGSSAGGHLALMLATTADHKEFEGDGGNAGFSSAVQAVVHWAGPTDLAKMYPKTVEVVRPFMARFLGGTPDQVPQIYQAASPINYVHKNVPPILSLHGEVDEAVPLEQSKALQAKMKKCGATNELILLKGQGHSYDKKSMHQGLEAQYEFLDKYLKTEKSSK